jgi:N-acetylglucosaminyldiphosphoundecaprenol N-acetyl-beta-D-mannosaminyltransferase
LSAGNKAAILNLNIHAVCLALTNNVMRHSINHADLVFCDGDGVRWGLRILGQDPPEKIAVTRWIWRLAELASCRHYRLYLLGSKQGVAEKAAQSLQTAHPGLQIAGKMTAYLPKLNGPSRIL